MTAADRSVPRRLGAAARLASGAARGAVLGYLVLTLVSGVTPVVAAWLTRLVVDRLVDGAPLWNLVVALGAVGVVAAAIPQVSQYLRAEIDRRVGRVAQDRLLTAVDGFAGLGRFEDPRFLDRLRMAQHTADTTCGDILDGGLGVARSVVTVVGFVGSLFVLSPAMTALVVASGAPTVVAELILSRRRARMYWVIEPAQRREFFFTHLLSTETAAKEVRLFGAGGYLRGRMLDNRRTADAAKRRFDRGHALVQTALALLAAVVSGGGLLWAADAARHGRISVGAVVIFVAAVAGVQASVLSLAGDLARAHYAVAMFAHFEAVVRAGPDLPVVASGTAVPALRHAIELRDVWFRYADEHDWVLRGVDLVIPRGAAVALVGLNGSGKSTLVKLLCRFYDPTRGAILWDGVDLRDLDVRELRRRIGAVFQDFVEYDLTAAENVALSDVDGLGDRPRIRSAARSAGVDGVVEALPEGYDTLLSRMFPPEDAAGSGTLLSGGQWQRIALARAFFRADRDLMILDEPSAGLDAQAEAEVHQRVREIAGAGATCLLISHRLSAVRHADQVVVLAEGRVCEQGPPARLLATGGRYAELFTVQASGYDLER